MQLHFKFYALYNVSYLVDYFTKQKIAGHIQMQTNYKQHIPTLAHGEGTLIEFRFFMWWFISYLNHWGDFVKDETVSFPRLALARPDMESGIVFEEETINFHRKSSSSNSKLSQGWCQSPFVSFNNSASRLERSRSGELRRLENERNIPEQDAKNYISQGHDSEGHSNLESDFLGHRMLLEGTLLKQVLASKSPKCIQVGNCLVLIAFFLHYTL